MSSEFKYELWTNDKLKAELRKRKAKVSGKKEDLIKRLIFLDVNSIPIQPEAEYHMILPDLHLYKDLHAGMKESVPILTRKRLEEYLEQHDKCFEHKYIKLYEERFLRTLRIARNGEHSFLTSVVWAEMKKSVTYKVDIAVSNDAVIVEAQCECGAGQGPTAHCKHICTVYYAVIQFCITGSVLTELTCTQTLQSFHKAKPFKGSPMKASCIESIRGKDRVLRYDPRPQSLRNLPGSSDRVRNMCINFQTTQPMPVMHLFPPANPYALYLDHDYLPLNTVDQYLENEKVTKVTLEEAAVLEKNTRGQSRCKRWKSDRLKHITASKFGEICKATTRKDMLKLARSMTTSSTIRSAAIMHGKKYEQVAVEKYESVFGIQTNECGLFVSTKTPMLAATPDRVIDDERLLEVKCPYVARNKPINVVTVPYLESRDNNNLDLKKTHDYYYQVQGQLYCTDRQHCDFVIYTLKDFQVITINRDDKFIEDMVAKLLNFYESHFKDAVLDRFLFKDYYKYNF